MDDAMTEGSLFGRVALLSGAGTGLGRGLALGFAEAGAKVALLARSAEAPAETCARIRASGGAAIVLRGDVTDRASVADAVAAAAAQFGALDIVLQIAAHGRSNQTFALETIDAEEWDAQASVTLDGAFNLAHCAYPHLQAGGRGRFITVNSAYGLSGDGGNPIYAAVKGALRGFTKALAREWGRDRITVNSFAPSSESESTTAYFARNPALRAAFEQAIPLGRLGDPRSDIAPAVVAIASDAFGFVTGQTLPIDGGFYTGL